MKKSRVIFVAIMSLLLPSFGAAQVRVVGKLLRLTPAGREFMQPAWSPTGGWIAITSGRYDGIWLVKPDGTGLQQLTTDRAVGYKMQWSGDGKMLAGRAAKYENQRRYNAIKAYEIATKRERQLSDFRTMMPGLPQWAEGNQKLALFADRGLEFFQIVTNAGLQQTPGVSKRPLVFANEQGLIVFAAGATLQKRIQPVPGEVINAALSADGGRIVFEMTNGRLYVCKIDGTGLLDLGRGERPQWSPDGSKIAFMISSDDGHKMLGADIYVMRPDGAGKTNLTNSADRLEMNCSWSPDGKRLAYDERNSRAVWVMEVAEQKF
jgi:Tol biopolymer transport system component